MKDKITRKFLKAAAVLLIGIFIGPAYGAPPAPVYFTGASPTYLWMTLYGYLGVNGATPEAMTEIAVYDPDGILCGAGGVDIDNGGAFTLQIYGDDPGSPADEGAVSGDELTFVIYNPTLMRESDLTTDAVVVLDGTVGTPPAALPVTFEDMGNYNIDIQAAFDIPAGGGGGGGGGGGCFLRGLL